MIDSLRRVSWNLAVSGSYICFVTEHHSISRRDEFHHPDDVKT